MQEGTDRREGKEVGTGKFARRKMARQEKTRRFGGMLKEEGQNQKK